MRQPSRPAEWLMIGAIAAVAFVLALAVGAIVLHGFGILLSH